MRNKNAVDVASDNDAKKMYLFINFFCEHKKLTLKTNLFLKGILELW